MYVQIIKPSNKATCGFFLAKNDGFANNCVTVVVTIEPNVWQRRIPNSPTHRWGQYFSKWSQARDQAGVKQIVLLIWKLTFLTSISAEHIFCWEKGFQLMKVACFYLMVLTVRRTIPTLVWVGLVSNWPISRLVNDSQVALGCTWTTLCYPA